MEQEEKPLVLHLQHIALQTLIDAFRIQLVLDSMDQLHSWLDHMDTR